LVGLAVLLVIGEDYDILPWRRSPVWVVVTLFGTFVSETVSVVVLTGEDGRSSASGKSSFVGTIGDPNKIRNGSK
jgi:hypothetical protein